MVLYDLERFEAVLWENMAGKASRLERPDRSDTKTSLSHISSQLNFWLKKYRICKKIHYAGSVKLGYCAKTSSNIFLKHGINLHLRSNFEASY